MIIYCFHKKFGNNCIYGESMGVFEIFDMDVILFLFDGFVVDN